MMDWLKRRFGPPDTIGRCDCGGWLQLQSGKFYDTVLINFMQCMICGGCYYTPMQLKAMKAESRKKKRKTYAV